MDALIHKLTLLQEKEGWLAEESLRKLAKQEGVPLHRLESLSTFYTHFRRTPPKPISIRVCRDLSCMLAGGGSSIDAVRRQFASREDVEIEEVSCLGRCERAPAAALGHRIVGVADLAGAPSAIDNPAMPVSPPARRWEADVYARPEDRYGTLREALAVKRGKLPETLKASGLRGMGGAGFPTGLKWELVAKEAASPKYVICNADESEPGTFKDRVILDELPHLVLEGMILAGLAVGSERGWVFIRHEYEPERVSIEKAIEEAYAAGALGPRIFGHDFGFDIEIFVSPGGYILGEETALIECMEDKRGEPRNKPPFPGQKGLWNQPTLMNNVETFAHVVGILKNGVEWWKSLGKPGFSGHKFISVSGDVENPAVHLIPMGTTLAELLERSGGVKGGRRLAAVAPGGASSNFLPPEKLDVPIDFKTLEEAGSMLGSGAAVYVADGHELLEIGVNVARFFRNESCGKCVPCRVGSQKAVALLQGQKSLPEGGAELLDELNTTMLQTSICGLGQVALGPLLSILQNFPDAVPRE